MNHKRMRRRLMTILAADVAGYSRLMAADELATLAALDAARAVFKFHIESHQGRVIDMVGDSVLAAFDTVLGSVVAALAIQQDLSRAANSVPDDRRMRFRIGMHLGDVIEKPDGTVYGDGVNIAARLEGVADPGGLTVSDALKSALGSKGNLIFEDCGDHCLKNLEEPVRAFRVRAEKADEGSIPNGSLPANEANAKWRRPVETDRSAASVMQARSVDGAANEAVAFSAMREHSRCVGRTEFIAQLEGYWRKATSGERQVVFLTGDAGIGKTTLADMFLARTATAGIGALRARCVEHFGAGEAYLPLLEALGECCHGPSGAYVLAKLRQFAPTWLAQMPSLLEPTERDALQRQVLGATRDRMLREFCDFVESLSTNAPLILAIDDLHWSDYATLDVLSLLAQRTERARLLVLGSYRPLDVARRAHPVGAVRQELGIRRLASELRLDVLSAPEVQSYLSLRLSDCEVAEDVAQAIYRQSEGHPLFMVNLVDHLIAQQETKDEGQAVASAVRVTPALVAIPQNLKELMQGQLEGLEREERRCIEAASVAGAHFSAALLAAALNVDVVEAETVCERLARRGQWLKSIGSAEWPDGTVAGSYCFMHTLYIEVIYERIAPAQCARYHRHIAERLGAAYGENIREVAAQLAIHFERARDYGKAVHCLRVAAEHMAWRWAFNESYGYLSRALQLVERLPNAAHALTRIDLLQQRAPVRRSMGDLPGAVEDLHAIVASTQAIGDQRREIQALVSLSRAYNGLDHHQCLSLAAQALERAHTVDDDVLLAMVRANHADWNLFLSGWREEHARASEEVLAVARRTNDRRMLNASLGLHTMIEVQRSNYRQACSFAAEGMKIAESLGDVYQFSMCQSWHIYALMHLGMWGEALRLVDELLLIESKNGAIRAVCGYTLQKAWFHLEAMDFEGTLLHCERARELYDMPSGDIFVLCSERTLRAVGHAGLGNYPLAMQCLAEITGLIGTQMPPVDALGQAVFLQSRCECFLGQGDLARAREEARKLGDLAAQPPERTYLAHAHRLLAAIAMAEEAWDEAQAEIKNALDIVTGAEVPLAAWRVYLTAAAVFDRQGRTHEATSYRHRSREVIDMIAGSLNGDDPLRSSLARLGKERSRLGSISS